MFQYTICLDLYETQVSKWLIENKSHRGSLKSVNTAGAKHVFGPKKYLVLKSSHDLNR